MMKPKFDSRSKITYDMKVHINYSILQMQHDTETCCFSVEATKKKELHRSLFSLVPQNNTSYISSDQKLVLKTMKEMIWIQMLNVLNTTLKYI